MRSFFTSQHPLLIIMLILRLYLNKDKLTNISLFPRVAGPHYKVHCTKDNLRVDIVKQEDVKHIYLQHLKEYPGEIRAGNGQF